ncbi:hypothetical protein tpqmel_0532 [Candidatus Gastranaerophilus sp. (ex Termes propinquus)]|nr:hypothetical protein tpqmel_0522 [Candidatus Gastranaerophilus sp. (ex Termes propinquus)]GBF23128.1 hypothetical protein tpqmel_0532 [Candidatus Gastranaerophilus sp. (ex Termes propinquus)]
MNWDFQGISAIVMFLLMGGYVAYKAYTANKEIERYRKETK